MIQPAQTFKSSLSPYKKPRFTGQTQHPEPPSIFLDAVKSFSYAPLVHLVAKIFTEPRFAKKLVPSMFKDFISAEQAQFFNPIEPVDFKSLDGLKLKGHWMPALKHTQETVVMGHGYKANWRGLLEVADAVRKMGYNVFLFDFRGHGDSDGVHSSFGYHEGKDAVAAIDFVKDNYPEQAKELVYYGHSAGAAALMLTPKTLKQDYPKALEQATQAIDGLILDSPYSHIDIMKLGEIQPFLNWPGSGLIPKAIRSLTKDVVLQLEKSAQKRLNLSIPFTELQPAHHFKNHALAQKPSLQYHGTQDKTTPFEHAIEVHDILKTANSQTKLITLEGQDHWEHSWQPFNDGKKYTTLVRGGDLYLDEMKEFLEKTFKAS